MQFFAFMKTLYILSEFVPLHLPSSVIPLHITSSSCCDDGPTHWIMNKTFWKRFNKAIGVLLHSDKGSHDKQPSKIDV